ncbi:hypothetical protein WAE58_21770 [Pedobacter panaciterrae]|uniref:Uncharacterized protein n=1 Tax=Pedobacter panaciterrae TaxID=363849 RepID=A0ABU8NS49_9SPHI
MVDKRPHVASWTLSGNESPNDPVTGFPVATDDVIISVPCRYHSTTGKQFNNELNQIVLQKGRIRFDNESEMPSVYKNIKVTDAGVVIFEGSVMEVYRGQLGCRCDV